MGVREFFSNWDVYRLCIDHNTLHHREVGCILRGELAAREEPFDFLDLACGDAELTVHALAGSRIRSYTGVDFSAPALGAARAGVAVLGCPTEFHETDFTGFLRGGRQRFDAIYLGLSLHHLGLAEKRAVLGDLRRAVAPGGAFYLFEPILHDGESRDECLARWHAHMDGPYDAFPRAAQEALWQHVITSDFPESEETFLAMAREAGFSKGEQLFTDAKNFYSLFRFTA